MIDCCHLSVDAGHHPEVAVGGGGVGAGYGVVVAVYGAGPLAHVAVGAAQEVVGLHALVGRAVAVVPRGYLQHHGVGGKIDILLVHLAGAEQLGLYMLPLSAATGGEEQHK